MTCTQCGAADARLCAVSRTELCPPCESRIHELVRGALVVPALAVRS